MISIICLIDLEQKRAANSILTHEMDPTTFPMSVSVLHGDDGRWERFCIGSISFGLVEGSPSLSFPLRADADGDITFVVEGASRRAQQEQNPL